MLPPMKGVIAYIVIAVIGLYLWDRLGDYLHRR